MCLYRLVYELQQLCGPKNMVWCQNAVPSWDWNLAQMHMKVDTTPDAGDCVAVMSYRI